MKRKETWKINSRESTVNSISIMTSALVMVAKWPGSGKSKTRLSSQLAAEHTLQIQRPDDCDNRA